MIFQPSREEVRHFFIAAWQRHCRGLPLAPIEHLAVDWICLHPEYHPLLNDAGEALERDFTVEDGQVNPFLHLSMHLSLEEQYSIDQPAGVRGCIDQLLHRHQSRHDAMHEAMECLGEMLHEAQQSGLTPDASRYLECLSRAGSR